MPSVLALAGLDPDPEVPTVYYKMHATGQLPKGRMRSKGNYPSCALSIV
jgi:hypothetical protein